MWWWLFFRRAVVVAKSGLLCSSSRDVTCCVVLFRGAFYLLCSSIKYKTHLCFFLAIFFFVFRFVTIFASLFSSQIVHHVSRVRRVRAAVPHRQGTYSLASRRLPLLQPPSSKSSSPPFFLSSSPSFFSTPKRALKSSLFRSQNKSAHFGRVVHLSLSLSLSLSRNKAPSRDFEASRRKRQTSPPRRAWRER